MNWQEALVAMEKGELRCAQKINGQWQVNAKAKEWILEAFRAGYLQQYPQGFVDKHNLGPRTFNPQDNIRLVPGGSSIRTGAYLASGVVVMPPSYINIGAYIDEGSMVDSHVLVGSCAQIGKNVHLSAGVQIGGVLEPVGSIPVIIEDGAFIGAQAVIVEGIKVEEEAVIAPGVILSKSVPVYDLVYEKILPPGAAIPKRAVVISGTRPPSAKHPWGKAQGLQLSAALIVKYRDQKSDQSLVLEEALRND